MKSIAFVLSLVLFVATMFATVGDAAGNDRLAIRQPILRPNTTVIRQAPQRAAIVVQPRQQIVVQPRQNFVVRQPQAFVLQQPQAFLFQQPQQFFFQQPQAFSFGGHVQQFTAPGNCPSALLFR